MNKTKYITFYSYKGGVGRTLTLANIAYLYALEGKRVVIVDFDLEAPGISNILPFKNIVKKHLENKNKKGGIFEFILHYQKHKTALSLRAYYCAEPIPVDSDSNKKGEIYIIPAGKEDAAYKQKLQDFSWNRFYSEEGGDELFSKLRKKIEIEFDNPDVVLIDSRTGLTDIGGICTMLLPDKVVMLTGLNYQNITGVKNTIDSIAGFSDNRKTVNQEYEDIEIILTASHIPADEEMDKTNERIKYANEQFQRDIEVFLHYVAILSLEERVLCSEKVENKKTVLIVEKYKQLFDIIKRPYYKEEKNFENNKKELEKFLSIGKLSDAEIQISELITFYEKNKIESGDLIYYSFLKTQILMDKKKFEEAANLYNNISAFFRKGIKSDKVEKYLMYHYWGFVLRESAQIKKLSLEKRTGLLKQSVEKYEISIEHNPDERFTYNNLGNSISDLAKLETDKKRKTELLNQSIEKYKKAIELNPNYDSAYSSKSNSLIKLYYIDTNKNFLYQALESAQKANSINPQKGIYNQACAYSLLGEFDKSIEYLKKTNEAQEVSIKHISEDEDLMPLRNHPEYKKFITENLKI